MLKIVLNDDKDLVDETNRQLAEMKEKNGKQYCPCGLTQTDDMVCICKAFREQNYAGECNCGKYKKIEVD